MSLLWWEAEKAGSGFLSLACPPGQCPEEMCLWHPVSCAISPIAGAVGSDWKIFKDVYQKLLFAERRSARPEFIISGGIDTVNAISGLAGASPAQAAATAATDRVADFGYDKSP